MSPWYSEPQVWGDEPSSVHELQRGYLLGGRGGDLHGLPRRHLCLDLGRGLQRGAAEAGRLGRHDVHQLPRVLLRPQPILARLPQLRRGVQQPPGLCQLLTPRRGLLLVPTPTVPEEQRVPRGRPGGYASQ